MNDVPDWLIPTLHKQADEIAAAGHNGWGNTMREAAAALEAAREDAVDAARYRWLCDGNGYFMEEAGLCPIENEKPKADEAIDKAMRGEW